MINAETQLVYSSDYPHWDFDLPSTIYDLPFLSETAKRNILGGNANPAVQSQARRREAGAGRVAAPGRPDASHRRSHCAIRPHPLAGGVAACALLSSDALPRPIAGRLLPGKTIELYIGTSVGGGYDAYARMLARHMGKYIPGNPTIVPKNMEGGGGMRLANFLYNAAPKDGTRLRHLQPRHRLRSAARQQGAQFEATKFNWIGIDQQRGQRLRRLAHAPASRRYAGRARRASWSSAPPARARTPTSSPRSPTRCSAPSSRSSPAIRAATTSTSRWSAARCRAAAAGRGPA